MHFFVVPAWLSLSQFLAVARIRDPALYREVLYLLSVIRHF
jgi:hypothetical protein